MRRQSLALAGPPKSAKNRGGALIQDSALNQANRVYPSVVCPFLVFKYISFFYRKNVSLIKKTR